MASDLAPQPHRQTDFEGPLEVIPIIRKFHDLKKFIRTRKAVLDREPLYLNTKEQLSQRGMMGPWTFNAVQSFIDSVPGMVAGVLFWIVFPTPSLPIFQPFGDPVTTKLASTLSPLLGPFTLLAVAYLVAFAALPGGYANAGNLHTASRKYLYFDGSYGFWPQLFLASFIAMVSIPRAPAMRYPSARIIALVGALGLAATFVWQAIVTTWKVREELFDFDYLNNRPEKFIILQGSLAKFLIVTGIGAIIIFLLIKMLLASAVGLLWAVIHLIRGQ